MSPHILISQDLEEMDRSSCPPLYESLVLKNIIGFFQMNAITEEEFHYYCNRLNAAVMHRSRSAA